MSEWSDVTSRRQRRHERKSQGWRAQSCSRVAVRSVQDLLSRGTCRGCGKQRDVKQDEYINEWSQTVAWPQQSEKIPPGEAVHPVNKPKGAAQALALARLQLAQSGAIGAARRVHPHLGKRFATVGGGDESSSALGTEDGPSTSPISSRCRIWRALRWKAQAEL